MCFCLLGSVEAEAGAAMTETLNQDTEASCLKTKPLKLTGRETLTPAQLKVGFFLSVGVGQN